MAARGPRARDWTLVDQPGYKASNAIAAAAKRLESGLGQLPGVTIERNGSTAMIADMGEEEAGKTPMGYHSRTKTILIPELETKLHLLYRFLDGPQW